MFYLSLGCDEQGVSLKTVELLLEIITEGMYRKSQESLNHFLCCCFREEVSDAIGKLL